MNRFTSPRWAVILLGVAVLALGGCGRKGPLDLPPNSQAYAPSPAEADAQREASQPSVFDPSYGMNAPPTATKGTKRPFLLDPLLGN